MKTAYYLVHPNPIELKPGAQTLKAWLVESAEGKTPA
ncbi:hypothetical protein BN2476_150044 [Paraburkholderia piptadeniae]|uniref:Uncharacterized protein n=1 Tax=Paraburkholderia piptadeniae TaxID=1701573 RepID=A0A1N7RSF2_9BURK|nr:hypothetical protein BN2476_150044 [Paraburkholderia piptadeniae]